MYCGNCGKECSTVMSDYGIGPYEFWGARGTQHDYIVESDCCNDLVYIDKELTIEYTVVDYQDDFEDDEVDRKYNERIERELWNA